MLSKKKYGHSRTEFNPFPNVSILLVLSLMFVAVAGIRNPELAHSTIISKTLCFIYFVAATLVILLINITSRKRTQELMISKIDIALILIVGFIFINRYFIQELHSFSIRFIELIALIILYLILRFLPKAYYPWLVLSVVLAGIIQGLYGLFQALGIFPTLNSDFRITGNFVNPGPFAGFLTVAWILALGLHLFHEQIEELILLKKDYGGPFLNTFIKRSFHVIPLLAIGVFLVVIPAARSRASWIAIIMGTGVLFFFRYHTSFLLWTIDYHWSTFYKRSLIICITTAAIFTGSFGIYKFNEDSTRGRLLILEVSSRILKENPVFGVGYDRFKAHYMDAQANYFSERLNVQDKGRLADNTYYALNQPLQFTVENGITGLFILCFLGYSCVKIKTDISNKYFKHFCQAFIFSYFIFSFFSFSSYVLPMKMALILILALLGVIDSQKIRIPTSRMFPSGRKRQLILTFSFFLFVSVLVLIVGSNTAKLKKGFKGWQDALNSYDNHQYDKSLEKFDQVYPIFAKDGDFLMNYGKALTLGGQYHKAKEILKQSHYHLNTTVIETSLGDVYKNLKMYPEAEEAYQKAALMVPNRFYPLYLLVNLYMETGQTEKARFQAIAILEKEVKIPSVAIEEIKSEMIKIVRNLENK